MHVERRRSAGGMTRVDPEAEVEEQGAVRLLCPGTGADDRSKIVPVSERLEEVSGARENAGRESCSLDSDPPQSGDTTEDMSPKSSPVHSDGHKSKEWDMEDDGLSKKGKLITSSPAKQD